MRSSGDSKSSFFSIDNLINSNSYKDQVSSLEITNECVENDQTRQLSPRTLAASPSSRSSYISKTNKNWINKARSSTSETNMNFETLDKLSNLSAASNKSYVVNGSEKSTSSVFLSCSPTLSSSASSISSSSYNQDCVHDSNKTYFDHTNNISIANSSIHLKQENNQTNMFSNNLSEKQLSMQNMTTNIAWPVALNSISLQQNINADNLISSQNHHQQISPSNSFITMDSQLSAIQYQIQREQTFNMLQNGARFFDSRFTLPS
jgi:hypothetical protein